MCAKVTPDGQYQFGHFILQNSNRKYEFKSVFLSASSSCSLYYFILFSIWNAFCGCNKIC